MRQYNIHAAKTHLSALVDKAAAGDSFVIAKAGKPMVKVIPLAPKKTVQRIGFLKGLIQIPADFDQMGQSEIIDAFEGTANISARAKLSGKKGLTLLSSDKILSQYSPVIFVMRGR